MFYQFGFSLYSYFVHILFVYKLVLVILNWGSKCSLVFYTLIELSKELVLRISTNYLTKGYFVFCRKIKVQSCIIWTSSLLVGSSSRTTSRRTPLCIPLLLLVSIRLRFLSPILK